MLLPAVLSTFGDCRDDLAPVGNAANFACDPSAVVGRDLGVALWQAPGGEDAHAAPFDFGVGDPQTEQPV